MRKKIDDVLTILTLVGILLVALFFLRTERHKRQEITNNYIALKKDLEGERKANGMYVAEIEALTLQKNDFERLYTEQEKELKQLGIKVKRLQSISTTNITHEYIFDTVQIFDSVKVLNNKIDTLKCFKFTDNYINFEGCFAHETCFATKIQTVDTLSIALHKNYRKKFLFFHWKPFYKVTIISKNPYSTVTGAEHITITK